MTDVREIVQAIKDGRRTPPKLPKNRCGSSVRKAGKNR